MEIPKEICSVLDEFAILHSGLDEVNIVDLSIKMGEYEPKLDEYCLNNRDYKPKFIADIQERLARFMKDNEIAHSGMDIEKGHYNDFDFLYQCCEEWIDIIDYYFPSNKEHDGEDIAVKEPQQMVISKDISNDRKSNLKKVPDLIDLITIPEGSTTTKEEIIISVQSMLKVPKDIAMTALALWEKGYVSLQKEQTDIRKALFKEAEKIGIEAGSESNFNSHIRNHRKGNITELKDWISKLP